MIGLLNILKIGNENSGNYDHGGRPGQVGGSSTDGGGEGNKLSWKNTNDKEEMKRQFRREFGIKNVGGDLQTLNKFGEHTAVLLNRFPRLTELFNLHKLAADFQKKEIITAPKTTFNKSTRGAYVPRTKTIIIKDTGLDNFNNILDLKERNFNVGSGMGHVIDHELGHHVELSCLSNERRQEWGKIVSEVKNFESVSRYAMTNSGEAFAESFAKFVHPQYKDSTQLPKQAHDFMTKILTPKVKKQIGLSKILKYGNENSGSWNGPGDPRFNKDDERESDKGNTVFLGAKAQDAAFKLKDVLDKGEWGDTVKDDRAMIAESAVQAIEDGEKGIFIQSSKGTMAVAAYEKYLDDRPILELSYLATKELGHGREIMQQVCKEAAKDSLGIRLIALKDAKAFYKTIGMVEGKFSSFSFTPEQVKTFAEKANLKIANNEPENGGFAVRKEDLKKYEVKSIRKQIKGYLRG